MKKNQSGIRRAFSFVVSHCPLYDKIAAVLLVLCPLLQHYVGLVDNAATTVLLMVALYLIPRVLPHLKELTFSALKPVLAIVAFFVFKLFAHGTSVIEVGQVVLFVGFMVAYSLNCIDTGSMVKTGTHVAVLASGILLAQYFCYYILGFHLQMVPTGLLLPESAPWILGAQTGLAGITGKIGTLYRPSAFFLEPSHLFLYCFPFLMLNLFAGKKGEDTLVRSGLIAASLVLCTSGMGIATAACAIGLFLVTINWKERTFHISNITKKWNLILLGSLLGLFLLAVLFVLKLRGKKA